MNHVVDRILERYGVRLSLADLRALVGQIEAGETFLLGNLEDWRDGTAIERHRIEVQGVYMTVLYKKNTKAIITCEPPGGHYGKMGRAFWAKKAVNARRRKARRRWQQMSKEK